MIFYLFFGFFTGALIPFWAGRFGKLIPMDPGLLLLKLPHLPRFPKTRDLKRQALLKKKWRKLWTTSLLWGIFMANLFFLCFWLLPNSYIIWGCIFCWIQGILMAIDARYWLLPDFFTIPLLLLGFLFSFLHQKVGIQSALFGSISGYLLCVFSVFLTGLFSKKTMFGGGDLKMITALGTWLGILGLNYTLILSFFFFVIFNFLPYQKKGAYGPSLGLASIIIFFFYACKINLDNKQKKDYDIKNERDKNGKKENTKISSFGY